MLAPDDVLQFWFGGDADRPPPPDARQRWFAGGEALDAEIRRRFGVDVEAACAGKREEWAATPRGRVALVILLDQFTRNIHRNTARAFSGDARALQHACDAVDAGEVASLGTLERYFLYMPFMHAEDAAMQARACSLFDALAAEAPPGLEELCRGGVDFARRHARAIERFGRFPARNEALGRASTPEEAALLSQNPSGF